MFSTCGAKKGMNLLNDANVTLCLFANMVTMPTLGDNVIYTL